MALRPRRVFRGAIQRPFRPLPLGSHPRLVAQHAPGGRGHCRNHDLHHVLTEDPTTWRGEAEIAAWELASVCGRHVTVWLLLTVLSLLMCAAVVV